MVRLLRKSLVLVLLVYLSVLAALNSSPEPFSSNLGFVAPLLHHKHSNITSLFCPNSGAAMTSRLRAFFYVSFSIGHLQTYANLDTGSIFTWLQAQQCEICYDQGATPRYDYQKSSSYAVIGCGDEPCNPHLYGGPLSVVCVKHECQYNAAYPYDGTKSLGVLGKDALTLLSDTKKMIPVTLPGVVIGHDIYNYKLPQSQVGPGIIGLTQGCYRFLDSTWVSSFFHGIPTGHLDVGFIRFGSQAILTGQSIPLLHDEDGLYRIQMNGIVVSGQAFNIPSPIFDEGMVITTGIPITIIDQSIYNPIINRVTSLIKATPTREGGMYPCYRNLDVTKDVEIAFALPGYQYELKSNQI